MLGCRWSQTRPDLRYSKINNKVESPVRVAIRNRGSRKGNGYSNLESKQVFYLRTKQEKSSQGIGRLKTDMERR
jgi:hypothetical protein